MGRGGVGRARAPRAPDDGAPTNDASGGRPARAGPSSEQLALWAFVGYLVVAGPLILSRLGSYYWFSRDEFAFLAERPGGSLPPVLEPHGGAHWVAVPRLIYFVLWQGFGLTTYRPYQACAVAFHLGVVVLLRMVMRRSGVNPWLATAAASVLVLFGPGAHNIEWGFQIAFTGALAFGLVHLLLADHDGPFARRDLAGLGAGALAVMTSGVGVTMVAVVALAVLTRRGWRPALAHAAPLAALYGAWALIADPETTGPFGRPPVSDLLAWVTSFVVGTFRGLGRFPPVSALLVLVLVVGAVVAWGPWSGTDRRATRRRLAAPTALFVGGLLFASSAAMGRAWAGSEGAEESRYTYLGAAFTLPLLAVAAEALARRWRLLGPPLIVVFLLPIPFNLGGFDSPVFGPDYMEQRKRILTTAVRMPFARDVPPDVRPDPAPFVSDAVTIGFLLNAERNGDLVPSSQPIGPRTVDEFRIRLGVAARPATSVPVGCGQVLDRLELSPEVGDRLVIGSPVRIATRDGAGRPGRRVAFAGDRTANELTFELPDLELVVLPPKGRFGFTVCAG